MCYLGFSDVDRNKPTVLPVVWMHSITVTFCAEYVIVVRSDYVPDVPRLGIYCNMY
jgi:hypothetical protein